MKTILYEVFQIVTITFFLFTLLWWAWVVSLLVGWN